MRDFLLVKGAQTKQSLFCNGLRERSRKPFNARMRVEEISHAWP